MAQHPEPLGTLILSQSTPAQRFMIPGAFCIFAAFMYGLINLGSSLVTPQRSTFGPIDWAVTGIFLALGSILIITAYRRPVIVRFHTAGIARFPLGKNGPVQSVQYTDIKAVAFAVNVSTAYGIETGAQARLFIHPDDDTGVPPFRFRSTLKRKRDGFFGTLKPAPLEHIADAIADAVSIRMARDFKAGQTVPWTSALALSPAGLHASGVIIPFESITACTLKDERMKIYAGGKHPAVIARTSERNFLPGYKLFQQIIDLQADPPA